MTGDEVRRLRERLRLTQAQLADLVGVHKNSVARWERGEMGVRESAARFMRLLARMRHTDLAKLGKPRPPTRPRRPR